MPSRVSTAPAAAATAVARLPIFGAEASIGRASRIYRSPMGWAGGQGVAAVAASQWSDTAGSDAGTDDMQASAESDDAGDGDDGLDTGEAGDQDDGVEADDAADDAMDANVEAGDVGDDGDDGDDSSASDAPA